MTSFVQPELPRAHGGAERLANSMERLQALLSRLGSPAGMVSVLLAGGLAAVIVVAEQVVSAWADGHLLAAWIAMWVVVFGLLAVFADAIRAWPVQWQAWLLARRQAAAVRAADERTWSAAISDPRLMAELDCALLRAQRQAEETGSPMPHWQFAGTRPLEGSQMALNRDLPARGFRTAPLPGMPRHLQYLPD